MQGGGGLERKSVGHLSRVYTVLNLAPILVNDMSSRPRCEIVYQAGFQYKGSTEEGKLLTGNFRNKFLYGVVSFGSLYFHSSSEYLGTLTLC